MGDADIGGDSGKTAPAAQALQATRILKKLSPETQLYQVQRSVNSLQKELNQRYGDKNGPKLKVDEELGRRFLEAETQEERDEALRDIYQKFTSQTRRTSRLRQRSPAIRSGSGRNCPSGIWRRA